MAINKNFVVKNGIQVADSLIYGDSTTGNVGVGTTLPLSTLDVRGRINATSIGSTTLFVSGISTLGVTSVSTLNAQTANIVTGVVTTISGTTATYTNLNISGISTLTRISAGSTTGTSGQVLQSTGTGIGWTTPQSIPETFTWLDISLF